MCPKGFTTHVLGQPRTFCCTSLASGWLLWRTIASCALVVHGRAMFVTVGSQVCRGLCFAQFWAQARRSPGKIFCCWGAQAAFCSFLHVLTSAALTIAACHVAVTPVPEHVCTTTILCMCTCHPVLSAIIIIIIIIIYIVIIKWCLVAFVISTKSNGSSNAHVCLMPTCRLSHL